MARQLVRHGHFLVNGKKVNIPSFRVSAMDIIDVLPKSLDLTPFIVASAELGEKAVQHGWRLWFTNENHHPLSSCSRGHRHPSSRAAHR
jgi:hypothetical protein